MKLGWGTAYVSDDVAAKVGHCRDAGVRACLGGTLLEIAWAQGKVAEYVDWAHGLKIPCVEVSNGSVEMRAGRQAPAHPGPQRASSRCSPRSARSSPARSTCGAWCDEMAGDLDAGASWLVAEGRESGTVGLFEPDGEVRVELVEAIAAAVPVERVIFEAPRKSQQAVLISLVGPNVSLGNIAPAEVLSLETLRRGLRADTIDLALPTPAHPPA